MHKQEQQKIIQTIHFYYLLFTIRHSLFAIRYSLFAIHYSLLSIRKKSAPFQARIHSTVNPLETKRIAFLTLTISLHYILHYTYTGTYKQRTRTYNL